MTGTALLSSGLLAIGFLLVIAITVAIVVYTDDMKRWRRSLHAFRVYLPRNLTVDDSARWLAIIAATTHPPRWSPFPSPPVILEVLATPSGIVHYLLVNATYRSTLLAGMQATLPGARLEEDPAYLKAPARSTLAREFTLTSRSRPLATERVEPVSAGLLAALQPLRHGEHVMMQFIMTSAGTPAPVIRRQQSGSGALLVSWSNVSASTDADEVHARRTKQQDPLLVATLRLGATAPSRRRASRLLTHVGSMLPGLNASGVRLVRRLTPSFLAAHRLATRRYPLIEWPLLLNVHEAAGLMALPFNAYLPGLPTGQARQLPAPPTLPRHGTVVGHSNYPGLVHRALALGDDDRLQHVHIIGPTGTGKSTLLAQMALQDIAHGYGVIVIDPKGDLVSDIAARIPTSRIADVVFLDPGQVQSAIVGFNPLRAVQEDRENEAARELIADHVLGIFHALYREFWGPRTDEILRAALFSLTSTTAPDGSAFTLIEVPDLLTNPALRRYVSQHPTLPPHLRAFWQWFDGSLSEGDRAQAIGPVLNKLRAFSMRSSIRLLLGQSHGISFDELFRRRNILLISLAKGKLGTEAASLLGSLFLATLWHAAQARVTIPAEQRHPIFAYLDEFQDVVRLGADNTSLAEMLAQARGLGLSLTLAHQYLNQLPTAVREATLGTVRTHIAFQLEWDGARALEARFAPLSRDDLAGLNPFEFAMKPSVAGQVLPPVTGVTLPLGPSLQDVSALAQASRARHGLPRANVEAGLQARLRVRGISVTPGQRYGREITGSETTRGRT